MSDDLLYCAVRRQHSSDLGFRGCKGTTCEECQNPPDLIIPLSLDKLAEILNSTIRCDRRNKLVTFLGLLLTYTHEDQLNISFVSESSVGKSYIPLELAWYFPQNDVIEYSYISPTAFFHEYGTLVQEEVSDGEQKRHFIHINLCKKILIFIDQPHDQLLQRLRPLLSHDRKRLTVKITDRRQKAGLRTKTVVLEGYPTVIFCTAHSRMEDQERTRLLLLSPESSQAKLRAGVLLRIEKEGDRRGFNELMESDAARVWLRRRVDYIASAKIEHLIISREQRDAIASRFFASHKNLIPRHQRDITRLISLIKGHALLNLWTRERKDDSIFVNEEDIEAGFGLYTEISKANELGLPPEVYEIYMKLLPQIQHGVSRKEFLQIYFKEFHRTLGSKRLEEIVNLLMAVGLLVEELDPSDRRVKRLLPTGPGVYISDEKLNTPGGVGEHPATLLCHLCREPSEATISYNGHAYSLCKSHVLEKEKDPSFFRHYSVFLGEAGGR